MGNTSTDFLTITEAAERLHVSSRAVRRWVAFRKIEYVKAGRAVRIPRSEIDRIVKEGTIPREVSGPEWWRRSARERSEAVTR